MVIVDARPPNFDDIVAVLPAASRPGAIFSYGETVFAPGLRDLSPSLKAHEAVHGQRQGRTDDAIRAWWERYLRDPAFRLDEELPAHRAEYRTYRNRTRDRNDVSAYLNIIADRLSGPLYGRLLTPRQARLEIAR